MSVAWSSSPHGKVAFGVSARQQLMSARGLEPEATAIGGPEG